jgi:hypothetical protein
LKGDAFDFEAVYAEYPRKLGRKKGLQRCKSQITSREKYDALVRAVRNYRAIKAGSDEQYVMHFSTFMGCWEDYVEAKPGAVKHERAPPLPFVAKKRDAEAPPPDVLEQLQRMRGSE